MIAMDPGHERTGVVFSANGATMQGMEFIPTAEQDKITDAADTGANVVVTAVAGSGKTSTLKLIGASRPDVSFLYLAFGKDIQREMHEVLPNVESRTAHSLAWHYCKARHPHVIDRLNFTVLDQHDVAQRDTHVRFFRHGDAQ